MTLFFKSLDGRAWRALIAGWEPSTIIVDGKSIPKPKIRKIDAEEQAFMENS